MDNFLNDSEQKNTKFFLPAEKPDFPEPDAHVCSLTPEILAKEIKDYTTLLDDKATEHQVHSFLKKHSYFFNGILRLFGGSPLYSKVKLGDEYEVDFAWVDTGSFGPEWRFVEIESPTRTMFNRAGNPSEYLTHALQQVRDWHDWVHANEGYVKTLMPHITYPMAYLFIGRRSELTPKTRQRLRRLSFENRMFVRIHTLDWLADNACSVETLLHGPGRWWVPSIAYTHSQLRRKEPAAMFEWLQFSENGTSLESYRMEERDARYDELAEFSHDELWPSEEQDRQD